MKSASLRSVRLIAVLLPLAGLWGCGGGESFSTAPVSGKVMHAGKPVKGGSVQFSPVSADATKSAGKPASGNVNDDGTFTLSTYGNDDGAVLGKHTVTYTPPTNEAAAAPSEGGHEQEAKSPYDGLSPKQKEVEVKEGKNDVTIDLE